MIFEENDSLLSSYVEGFRNHPAFEPGRPVFLNSAGSSLPDKRVVDRMRSHLELEATIGGYEAANAAEHDLALFYQRAAGLVEAEPDDMAFMDGGTRAWNSIVYSTLGLEAGDEIVTAPSEFGSNLVSLLDVAHRHGATIRMARVNERGAIDRAHLATLLNRRTRLVAISLINAHTGTVNDLDGLDIEVRAITNGALYVVDACQAVGQIPVSVRRLGCDVLTATGRKWLRGPRGTGFLYVRSSVRDRLRPPTLDQANAGLVTPGSYPDSEFSFREDALRFETWERSIAAVLGLSEAILIVDELGIDNIHLEVARLAKRLRAALVDVDGVDILEDVEEASGIVCVAPASAAPWDLVPAMSEVGFSVGMMPRWVDGPAFAGPSHRSALRLSPHFFNTNDEIDAAAQALAPLVTKADHPHPAER